MVGCDAGADEPPGGGQALDHVDVEAPGGVLEQVPGGVEAGGTGADDGDADGGVVGHRPWRGQSLEWGCEGDGRGPTRTGDPLGVSEVL